MGTAKVFILFLKAIFSGLLNIGSPEWRIAGKELISKRTFRLPDSSYNDRFIGLRLLSRTFANLKMAKIKDFGIFKVLILDSSQKVYGLRKDYILKVKQYNDAEVTGITKDVAFSYISVWPAKLFLLLLSTIVLPATVFSRNRVQWALVFSEFIEISAATEAALKMNVKIIHHFSPAEKDANLSYLIMHKTGIKITKHPSPGALVAHNKNLMADILALSSRYQMEEYNLRLKDTIRVSATELCPPETSLFYMNLYTDEKEKFENKLGFYSHGGWCRKKEGKLNGLFAKPEEEEKCLDMLKALLSTDPSFRLIIFLHPKEKKYLEETERYYSNWFEKDQIIYFTDPIHSSHVFYKAEIGIGSYSTVLFERDYFGFKILVLREDEREFPLKGTQFYNYSFGSAEELKQKVEAFVN